MASKKKKTNVPHHDGPVPPDGTITVRLANQLPGFRGRSHQTVRRALDALEVVGTWAPSGRKGDPDDLYDAHQVHEIAAARLAKSQEPKPPRKPKPGAKRSAVFRKVPDDWGTAAEILERLEPDRVDPGRTKDITARTVRRWLEKNCVGPPVPDALDTLICDAFDQLFVRAGLSPLVRHVPSEERLIEQTDRLGRTVPKRQRVYPLDEAVDWIHELCDSFELWSKRHLYGISGMQGYGLVAKDSYRGRRNPWLPFVAAFIRAPEELGNCLFACWDPYEGMRDLDAEAHGYFIRAAIERRRSHWLAARADATEIAEELATQLERVRSVAREMGRPRPQRP